MSICFVNFIFITFYSINFAFAGGILIDKDTLLVNNSRAPYIIQADRNFELEFMADQYIYGRRGDNGYIVFVIEKELKNKMLSSVGKDKTNKRKDIIFVQSNLKRFDFWTDELDGKWSMKLFNAIKNYQKSIGFKRPDGIIEKNGITHKSFTKKDRQVLIAL